MNKMLIHMSQVSEGMTLMDTDEVERLADMIKIVKNSKGTLYLFGNGGSHATASHFCNDLNKIVKVKAVCVGDLTPVVTAYGNDNGWERMFSSHLQNVLARGDGVIGISCSGNSINVLNGLLAGLQMECLAGGLTGMSDSNKMSELGLDALVHARVPDIRVQEDLHMIVCHAVVRMLQETY